MASLDLEDYFPLIISSIILLITILTLRTTIRPSSSGGGNKLPPGPWKLPVIGNLHQLITIGPSAPPPHQRLKQLADKNGRCHVMRLQLGELSSIVISTPEAARQVLKLHDHAFSSRPYLLAADIIFYGNKGISFSPAGDYWRQMRKLCIAELLSPKRVRSFRSIRESEASKLVAAVRSRISSSSAAVDVTALSVSATSGTTYRAAFGMVIKKSEDEAKFSKIVADISDATGGFRVSDLFPSLKFLPAMTGFKARLTRMHLAGDAMLGEIIREHRARKAARDHKMEDEEDRTEDLVDVLMNLMENQSPHHQLEVPLTMEITKAIIMEMFVGGTESSATTIEWIMSELMKNPRVMQKAQEEVRRVFHNEGNVVKESELHDLKYLDSVIKENLRLHPPIPLLIPREITRRVQINDDYDIPEKARIIINVWAIGRDPRHWKEPEKFCPERFLECPTSYKGADFRLTPFGSGRRSCPGLTFGMAIVKLMVANLLYHFDWKLPEDGMEPEDLDMAEHFGLAVRRKYNLCLVPVAHDPMH